MISPYTFHEVFNPLRKSSQDFGLFKEADGAIYAQLFAFGHHAVIHALQGQHTHSTAMEMQTQIMTITLMDANYGVEETIYMFYGQFHPLFQTS